MKSKNTKYIILGCIVILIVVCFLVVLFGVGGAGVAGVWPFNRPTATDVPTPVSETETVPQGDDIPAELVDAMTTIEGQVSSVRGLTATAPVAWTLISEAELEEIVREDFFADYTDEDAQKDVQILSVLGLLPDDFDLKEFYNALYSEQIAGFYDNEEEAMYVVQGAGFGGSEKLTYAHEYTHVLQDQVYDLDEGLQYNDEACEADSERCAAIQALIEGDATLTELNWFQNHATQQDYEDLVAVYENYESPILDSAPPYMAADLYFPYEKGQAFVETLFAQGGYAAIDAAYANVPVSTEQIMHPDRYPADMPVTVSLPDLTSVLGGGWSLYDQNVMGEWYTFMILNMAYDSDDQLAEETAAVAAEGWGGDAYAFYLDPETDSVAFVMDTVWDTTRDADEFSAAFDTYADLRWEDVDMNLTGVSTWAGPDSTVIFWQDVDRTIWVTAPTAEMAQAIFVELQ